MLFKLSSPTIVSAGSSSRNVFLKNQLYVRLEEEMLLCFYHRLRRRPISLSKGMLRLYTIIRIEFGSYRSVPLPGFVNHPWRGLLCVLL